MNRLTEEESAMSSLARASRMISMVSEMAEKISLAARLYAELRALAFRYLDEHHVRARSVRFDVASVRGTTVEIIEAAF